MQHTFSAIGTSISSILGFGPIDSRPHSKRKCKMRRFDGLFLCIADDGMDTLGEFNQSDRRSHQNKSVTKDFGLFLSFTLAQLTYRDSRRHLETCLRVHQWTLYHRRILFSITKSTQSDANESRDWRIYQILHSAKSNWRAISVPIRRAI